MSQWTHINGAIRVDYHGTSLRDDDKNQAPNPKITLMSTPTGSEGPLKIKFNRIRKEKYSPYLGILNIFGDLRDYNDAEEIFSYVKGLVSNLNQDGYSVRQCNVSVWVEGEPIRFIYDEYESSSNELVMVTLSPALTTLFTKKETK